MDIKTISYHHNFRNTTRGHYKETFHAHPGIEFCYVHEGTGNLWLDNCYYEIVPGTLMIFQPFQLHRVQIQITENSPFVRTVIAFDPVILKNYLPLLTVNPGELLTGDSFPLVYSTGS